MLVPAFLAVAPTPVMAKSLSRIIADSGLSPQDFDMMRTAEHTLYATASPKVGKTANWDNPQSGSRGSVKLDSMQSGCAMLHHVVYPKGRPQALELRNRMCKSSDGRWLVTP
jgi:surface antigen